MSILLFALMLASAQASLDLNQVGCGSLLSGKLLEISSASFSASSGNPGVPVLSGSPWIPTTNDNDQYLTVDLGQTVSVSKVVFAGDPTKPDTTNQIRLSYSYDGKNFHCIEKKPGLCKPFYSSIPPPVPGSNINEVDLGKGIQARYFRFQPLEPSPMSRPGASSLRVDLKGCIQGCGSLLSGKLLEISKISFSASSGTPGVPVLSGSPWIPTLKDNNQYLTVDLGKKVSVYRMVFAGDASKPDTTNQIKLYSSTDGANFQCLKTIHGVCKPYYSKNPPPVPGSDVNEVDLGAVVKARYFRFWPVEPSAETRDGASSLRVDIKGCVKGCGLLLSGHILPITCASFSATSGNPGVPVISGNPWIPTIKDNQQKLTVDLGQQARVFKMVFAGDPTKPDTTNQIKLFYSNDGKTFDCVKSGSLCRRFYSKNPPPVPGSDINEVDLGKVIQARYFQFQPLEPSPSTRDGASSLRVELIGCIET